MSNSIVVSLGLRVCQSEFMAGQDACFFNAHACRVFCQAVARGVQELQAEMREIAQELVHIHRERRKGIRYNLSDAFQCKIKFAKKVCLNQIDLEEKMYLDLNKKRII